ncbi:hypothetical protein P3S67_028141 [Capsicum chacoense]
MNFTTKVLGVIFLISLIFLTNIEAIDELAQVSCERKCRAWCVFDLCFQNCLKKKCHVVPPSSSKASNCQRTCSVHRCSKFKEDVKLMGNCLDECSTKYCT